MVSVSIIMGSDSDMPVMSQAAEVLEELSIEFEIRILSAHRQTRELIDYLEKARERGIKVIIAGAGKAAALPGICASVFPLPVIGIPMKTSDLGGLDSLYSIVQMPSGVPVSTVAINGAKNAALMAARILALSDENIEVALTEYNEKMVRSVSMKDQKLQDEGYKAFLEK